MEFILAVVCLCIAALAASIAPRFEGLAGIGLVFVACLFAGLGVAELAALIGEAR